MQTITIDQAIPAPQWEQIVAVLLQASPSLARVILTEQVVRGYPPNVDRLVIVISAAFKVVLIELKTEPTYQLQLVFSYQDIKIFLQQLTPRDSTDQPLLEWAWLQLSHSLTNSPSGSELPPPEIERQRQVCSALMAMVVHPSIATVSLNPPLSPWQQQLLTQMTTQIWQNLDLSLILQTTLEQVQRVLEVDRLLIYQLQPHHQITHEALAAHAPPSLLGKGDPTCLHSRTACYQRYLQGEIQVVSDVEATYADTPCLLALLQQSQVRAKLIIPIRVQEQLWGLLIAHQCDRIRQWQPQEQQFLQQIGQHLAIAIQQDHLQSQLQQQKQTLEQRVIERTQALYDALLSTHSAHRAKSDFLATINHELRTPLTCVIGMSATLLRWSLGPLNDKQRSYLKTIHDSGEHLLELINDILDLSQVEAGKAVLSLSEFSLNQLCRQALRVFREKAQAAEVELKLESLIPSEFDRFYADQRRVRQILFNLLSNAIKFTPAGGRVTLRSWVENGRALFQVEDTGIGIPLSQQPLLFQKFQQLDTSYTRSYEGVGLGLALTKQLVELHRGRIEVESTEGMGSIFTVELPAQSPTSTLSAGLKPNLPPSDFLMTGRIVLLESDEETATLICDILTAAGYQVVWIMEPSTAVEQIQYLQPIAVITAIDLPNMDGEDIIRQLRLYPPFPLLKILALTAVQRVPANQLVSGFAADAYLYRPIDPVQLLDTISTLFVTPASLS